MKNPAESLNGWVSPFPRLYPMPIIAPDLCDLIQTDLPWEALSDTRKMTCRALAAEYANSETQTAPG